MKKKIGDLTFYCDTFKEEIVLTKDRNAPPERYFIVYGGNDDIYIDTFAKGVYRLDYAYLSFSECRMNVGYFLEKNNFKNSRLYSRRFPMKKFIDLLKDYGFKVINDEEIEVEDERNDTTCLN